MEANGQGAGLEIAIVGMAGRFPGAPDIDAFWANIRDGVESVRRFTDQELRELGVPESMLSDPSYVKAGAVLDGMDLFDAEFFGYTPRDAAQLDPQQRLFLECAWQALEHAGYDPQRCRRSTGVYAGCGASLYLIKHLLPRHSLQSDAHIADLLSLLSGNAADSLCTRVAYKLNLQGPAVSVQTACSTSLMAVHVASQALLGHECEMALAGGVSLNLLQAGGYRHQAGAIFSPDGHCRAFDAKAEGTLLGSGAAIVVLKRLEDALRDGDTIHAVIKGSAANNDGSDKVGFTAPSIQGQAAAIRTAHAVAGVSADSIGYVEAHGTGTTLGDPVEIAALTQAFRGATQRHRFCAIGSVKANVGHLDAAAGAAGLIKAVLALKHQTLPVSINFEQPNPRIDFDASPFYVSTETKSWPRSTTPRRAGVSSFGIGGTNVHVVVEEASPPPIAETVPAERTDSSHVLPLSARSEEALRQVCVRLADHLEREPGQSLGDVAHTLFSGRARFAYRTAVLAKDAADAVEQLRKDVTRLRGVKAASETATVAFLFPGQGAQHIGMGRSLYEGEPVFRETLDRCCERLASLLGRDPRELLYSSDLNEPEAAKQLEQTGITQPALFAVEYSMAQLWMSWGVKPDAMLGHSIGEYVAACLAGVFALDDALEIVALRGRLLEATARGAMLAVGLGEQELRPFLKQGCEIAAVNASDSCVLSGPHQGIERAEQEFSSRGVALRRLRVSHAFHSRAVEPMLGNFEQSMSRFALSAPRIPFVSNLSGQWITADEACSPRYWANHVRGTVRFAEGLRALLTKSDRMLLEVGPGDTLSTLAKRHPDAGERTRILASQCRPDLQEGNATQPARCVAQLWSSGIEMDAVAWGGAGRRRIPLPSYPFERRSHWISPPAPGRALEAADEPLAQPQDMARVIADWFYVPSWKRTEPARPGSDSAAGSRGSVLVLSDQLELGERLMDQLRPHARSLIRVQTGAAFARCGLSHYQVRPGNGHDFERLLREVESETGPISDICHLWSLRQDDGSDALAETLERGFHSLVGIAQAIGADRKVSITVVTNGVEDVTGAECLHPEQATLIGPCRTIPQEYANISCRLIDVCNGGRAGSQEHVGATRLAMQIVNEMQSTDREQLVALRGSHCWIKSFERVRRDLPEQSRLRKRGVYLITGGLGGVGLTLAKHLAKHWQARLVLVGRSVLPSKDQWPELAERSEDLALRTRLKALLELEQLGAELLVKQADVTDRQQVRAAIVAAGEHFGELHGVIHAAGVGGGGLIAGRTRAAIESVFAPKLAGTVNLLRALAETPLDFVLLCSSLTAVIGGVGQVDYCAANCFLDAVAVKEARRDRPVISIDWDVWRQTGMAAGQRLAANVGIPAAEGGEAFERLIASPRGGQIVVSTLDMQQQFAQLRSVDMAKRVLPQLSAKQRRHPRPALGVAYVEPSSELERDLVEVWSEFLGLTPIGVNDNLFELGGDSLLAIQLLAKVRGTHGIEIHPAAFFTTPTVAELALMIESRIIEEIERFDEPARARMEGISAQTA